MQTSETTSLPLPLSLCEPFPPPRLSDFLPFSSLTESEAPEDLPPSVAAMAIAVADRMSPSAQRVALNECVNCASRSNPEAAWQAMTEARHASRAALRRATSPAFVALACGTVSGRGD